MARGRKSSASLAVVAGMIDERPHPPAGLTKAQTELWRRVVAGEPASFFKTAATQAMLVEFCRHVEASHVLAQSIDAFDPAWLSTDEGLDRYGKLLKLRDVESKAIADRATKLRLTNQSRYVPHSAGRQARNAGAEAKPWTNAASA